MAVSAGQPCRMLIIDDNRAIHDDIRKILGRSVRAASEVDRLEAELFGELEEESVESDVDGLKFEIDSAFQGQEGLTMVKKAAEEGRPYMVAVVDVRMPPGWDGIETIGRLWEVDPLLQVVICTAYSDHSWEDIIKRLGQSDALLILKKPFDRIEVLQLAHALTKKWTLQRKEQEEREGLESIVQKRTSELENLNVQLRKEVDERKQAEEDLKHLATHDALTDLPNRILMNDRLNLAMERARRFGGLVAVCILDLDHFKEVNDVAGHEGGDHVLREASERLLQCARRCDTVARLGGDEFVAVLADLRTSDDAETVAERIIEAFQKPFAVDGHQFNVTISIGISLFPHDCEQVENLAKTADTAMYRAKEAGRSTYRFYGAKTEAEAEETELLKRDLVGVEERDELTLWYQPLLDLQSGSVCSVEALLRWEHPERGMLGPMEFLPLAERSGGILAIGEWVLRRACEQGVAWRAAGLPTVPISVNLSGRQFQQADLVERIHDLLEETGFPSHKLVLEVTESTVMRDYHRCMKVLNRLFDLGIRIVLDDFGSGYASVNKLKELPLGALKIDRFFLQHVAQDRRHAALVISTIAMAHALRIQVIAEGVEKEDQLTFLRSIKGEFSEMMRCDMVQGFLFSKPVPAEEAARLLSGGLKAQVPKAG